MSEKFSLKKLHCATLAEAQQKIKEAEVNWLVSLLSRVGIPKIMTDKVLSDNSYGKGAWRDYLFDTHGIYIIKDITKQKVVVTKVHIDTGDKLVIGEWLKPEIVKIQGDSVSYDVNLKYWQLV